MKKNRFFLVLTIILALSLLLGACAKSEEKPKDETKPDSKPKAEEPAKKDEKILIGGSIFTLQYPWFLGAQEGMEKWLAEHPESNVKFQFEDSNQDIQTNISSLENMAAAGCKGIVIFPTDSKAIIPTMVDLHKNKDIKFVVGDYAQQAEKEEDIVWETFVGHDMLALGRVAGEVAVDYFKKAKIEEPTIIFITVPTSGEVTQQRLKGFFDAVLKEFPKANIIEEGDTGAADRNSAQNLMENVLQRESKIDLVCGHNDAEVIGAYNATVAAGREKEIKFIGIAGDKEVIKYIAEGNEAWIGEVLQDPVVLGYTAMEALWAAMSKGEKLPDRYDLPQPEALTPDNISKYDWKTWKWLG